MKKILSMLALAIGFAIASVNPTVANSSGWNNGAASVIQVRDHRYGHRRGYRYGHRHRGRDVLPWIGLGLGLGVTGAIIERQRRHREWCYYRYRSYDARTDTFIGYDGRVRRCLSPYN